MATRLGIDFGTTRTVVAACDRGNFPVVGFEGPDGGVLDHWPTLVATNGKKTVFGWDAAARVGDRGWTVVRSAKRLLAGATQEEVVRVGKLEVPLAALLRDFLVALRRDVLERSNLPIVRAPDDPIEAMVAVPAGASSAQRFLMLDAFRAAGFAVTGVLNEPSAAGVEYAHRYRKTLTAAREDVLVYDLGGGTFDVSLVRMGNGEHEVRAHAGDNHLGGDDFDAVLLELALAGTGAKPSDAERTRLLEHCRVQKEALNPNSRKVAVELEDGATVTIPVADYYAACEALVDRTLDAVARVLPAGADERFDCEALAGVYVVGGASDLPVVARRLRDVFGRRVKRSAYPSASTAVGLAIAAEGGPRITERFSRAFGVFREVQDGADVGFDAILEPTTEVAAEGAEQVRRYRARHNVGCFRFAECARLDGGVPVGDLMPWSVVRFPFDPALQAVEDLDTVPVRRLDGEGPLVEERYQILPSGIVEVRITDLGTGFSRNHRLNA